MARFYIPAQQEEEKVVEDTIQLTLSAAQAHALLTLVTTTCGMAGEDAYYGHICQSCGKRFVHEGEKKHEEGCPVPLAEALAPYLTTLEPIASSYNKMQELLKLLP